MHTAKSKKMQHKAISIRPFIGAKDFELSRSFYRDLGFDEKVLTPTLSVFKIGELAFYLQNGYVKDWVDNTMIFLEVDDVGRYWNELLALGLTAKYKGVRLTPIKENDWGSECFLHDPSGILWHFGAFYK
jgi:catechol 2,3-dioxygenase-like lactoylglutathione lyase family enzyme